ncbi:MAG: DMT family transporter [Desulfobacteraceae bacterium]|nr:MAG: DMT family transporter [Desulfobacteraceae bacterium]
MIRDAAEERASPRREMRMLEKGKERGLPLGLDLKALILMIVICASWGLNHPFTKVSYADISPILAAALRSMLAFAGLLVYARSAGISLRMGNGAMFHAVILGLIFGVEFVLFYVGIDLTLASRGAILLYTQPFFTALMAHFFLPGDRLNWKRSLGLILSFIGAAAVIGDAPGDGRYSLQGDLFCITAGFLWAATTVYLRVFMVFRATAVQTLFYELLYSFPVLLAASFLFEPVRLDLTWRLTGILFYQGIGVACISYVIFIHLVYRYQISTLSAFTFIAPASGVIFSGFILNDPMTVWLWSGLGMVSIGLWMVNRN